MSWSRAKSSTLLLPQTRKCRFRPPKIPQISIWTIKCWFKKHPQWPPIPTSRVLSLSKKPPILLQLKPISTEFADFAYLNLPPRQRQLPSSHPTTTTSRCFPVENDSWPGWTDSKRRCSSKNLNGTIIGHRRSWKPSQLVWISAKPRSTNGIGTRRIRSEMRRLQPCNKQFHTKS